MSIFYRKDLITDKKLEVRLETEANLVNGKVPESQLPPKADLVNGKVPESQLPSYVDDVIEVANLAALPVTGEAGKIYVTTNNGKVFRWTGSIYAHIGLDADVQVFTGTISESDYSTGGTYEVKVFSTGLIGLKVNMTRITTTADFPTTTLFTLSNECKDAINETKTSFGFNALLPMRLDSGLTMIFDPANPSSAFVFSSSSFYTQFTIRNNGDVFINNSISRFSLPSNYSVLQSHSVIQLV